MNYDTNQQAAVGLGVGCHLHLEYNRLDFGKIGLGN